MTNSLDNLLKNKYLTFYNAVKDIKNGVMPPPRMLILYPTNFCPCRCIYCDYAELNAQTITFMSTEMSEDIISEFAGMGGKAVELCGGGEPLATACADRAIIRAHDEGLSVGVLTNGWCIDTINAEYCDYIRISYDAGTPEMYAKIKQVEGEKFNEVLELVKDATKDSPKTDFSYKYTISGKPDINDIAIAYTTAALFDYDSFQLRLARNVEKDFKGSVDFLKLWVEHLQVKTPFIFSYASKLDFPCFLSPLQVVVDYNLDVWTCCYYRHRMDTHLLGNLKNKSLEDIWYSDHHWHVVESIKPEECNKYDCRFINANITWNELLGSGRIDSV